MALREHLRGHLARVAGVDAVVAGRRGEQHFGIGRARLDVLVRAVFRDHGPVPGQVGVAVFGHPRGAGEQLVVAPHVEQRHAADDRGEQLGPLHHGRSDQQPAVAAAFDAEALRAGDATRDQVFGDGDEVVVAALLVGLDRRLVPGRAVLAAAAQVRDHEHATVRKPAAPVAGAVTGLHRDLEAAVAVEQRRGAAVGRPRRIDTARPDHEVGHVGAIGTGREELIDVHAGRVEVRGLRLQRFARVAAGVREPERVGREEVGVAQQVVFGQRIDDAHRIVQAAGAERARERRGDRALREAVRAALPLFEPARDVVEHVDDHMAARRRVAGQGARRGRCEQDVEAALAGKVGGRVGREQRAAREGLASHGPVAAQFDQQRVVGRAGAVPEREPGIVGHVDPAQFGAGLQEMVAAVEVDHAHETGALVAWRRVDPDVGRHVIGADLEHRRRRLERRAARPALDDPRVARARHRAGTEIGAHIKRVGVDPFGFRLGLGQREAPVDEGLGDRVELAQHGRVGTAARQRDQHSFIRRRERHGAAPDPVLALGLRERIEVEHGLPGRRGLAVFGQRGAAPQAALVGLVLPEVVEVVAATRDLRDALLRVHHLEQTGADRLVLGPRLQDRLRMRVALANPGEGALAEHVFEPEVCVVGCVCIGHRVDASKPAVSGWRCM